MASIFRIVSVGSVLRLPLQHEKYNMDSRQATVAEWVATRNIFDVCVIETGYKGGRRLRLPWWRQEAAENHLRFIVEAILEAARVRRRQESGRHGGSEGGSEGGGMDREGYRRGRVHRYSGLDIGYARVGG